jgi:hypothetical protein
VAHKDFVKELDFWIREDNLDHFPFLLPLWKERRVKGVPIYSFRIKSPGPISMGNSGVKNRLLVVNWAAFPVIGLVIGDKIRWLP